MKLKEIIKLIAWWKAIKGRGIEANRVLWRCLEANRSCDSSEKKYSEQCNKKIGIRNRVERLPDYSTEIEN